MSYKQKIAEIRDHVLKDIKSYFPGANWVSWIDIESVMELMPNPDTIMENITFTKIGMGGYYPPKAGSDISFEEIWVRTDNRQLHSTIESLSVENLCNIADQLGKHKKNDSIGIAENTREMPT